MGDDKGGAPLQQRLDPGLHQPFCVGIDTGGGLIQDQDPGGGEHGAGKSQKLTLADGELGAPLADFCVVALFHFHDEVVDVDGFCRGDHFLLGGVFSAVTDIFPDRSRKEEGILGHHADLSAQAGEGHLPDVAAVDENRSLCHIVKSADQIYDRCFSGSGGAYQGDRLPWLYGEVYILQHQTLRLIAVGEAHILKADGSLHRRKNRASRQIGDLGRRIEDVKNPFRRRDVCDDLIVEIGQVPDGAPEHPQVGGEGKEGSHADVIDAYHPDADEVQEKSAQPPDDLHKAAEQIPDAHGIHVAVPVLLGAEVEALLAFLFRRKALDDADAGEVLVDVGVQVGVLLPVNLPQLVGGPLDHKHSRHQQGEGQQGSQSQLPVFGQHDAGYACHGEQVGDQLCHAVRQDVL